MDRATTHELISLAWDALPARHRQLLDEVGASQWAVVARGLGDEARDLCISAGLEPPIPAQVAEYNTALGMWLPDLRLALVNEAHQVLREVDSATRDALVTWVAWHEWGHALSITSSSPHDPTEGSRLLELAPPGIRERVRLGGYSRQEYIHELIAETYAMLMRERFEGRCGRPSWLPSELYRLIERIGTL